MLDSLLGMNFEQTMTYLRQLEAADIDMGKLFKLTTKEKVKHTRLAKYESEWQKIQKQQQAAQAKAKNTKKK